jgi:hypothetical protein
LSSFHSCSSSRSSDQSFRLQEWFEFNDSQVRRISKERVLERGMGEASSHFSSGYGTCAYMLCYRKYATRDFVKIDSSFMILFSVFSYFLIFLSVFDIVVRFSPGRVDQEKNEMEPIDVPEHLKRVCDKIFTDVFPRL